MITSCIPTTSQTNNIQRAERLNWDRNRYCIWSKKVFSVWAPKKAECEWVFAQGKLKHKDSVKKKKLDSYDSLAQTQHSQDPSESTILQLRHTSWLQSWHWSRESAKAPTGCRHRAQILWLYLTLPRLAPFLFTSWSSVFNFLFGSKHGNIHIFNF